MVSVTPAPVFDGPLNASDLPAIESLRAVLISGFQTGGSNTGGTVPVEQVSFNFTDVDVQTTDARGQWVSQVSCNFGGKFTDGQGGHEHDR